MAFDNSNVHLAGAFMREDSMPGRPCGMLQNLPLG